MSSWEVKLLVVPPIPFPAIDIDITVEANGLAANAPSKPEPSSLLLPELGRAALKGLSDEDAAGLPPSCLQGGAPSEDAGGGRHGGAGIGKAASKGIGPGEGPAPAGVGPPGLGLRPFGEPLDTLPESGLLIISHGAGPFIFP